MSKENVKLFRKKFRENNIPKYYSGIAHLLFNFIILISLCIFLFLQVKGPTFYEFLSIPFTLIMGNLAVYIIHKYPLHRQFKFIDKFTYGIHTKWHHFFYTNEFVIYEKMKDFYILFFPPTVIIGFSFVYIPANYFVLKTFLPLNVVYFICATSTLYFLLYEVFHYISHLRKDHPMLKFPLFRLVWNHHVTHHDPRLMHQYNFNIVFPLFDYVFGTVYKDKVYEK